MNRRTALQTAAVGLAAGLAGCASSEGDPEEDSTEAETPEPDESNDTTMTDGDTDETEDAADTIDSDRVAGASFTHTGECSDPETADIEFLDSEVEAVIIGCIEGRNGCAVPVLAGGSEDNGTLRVEVGEVDISDDDMMCTQQIVQLGYELRLPIRSRSARNHRGVPRRRGRPRCRRHRQSTLRFLSDSAPAGV